jgi:5'-nucleotidase
MAHAVEKNADGKLVVAISSRALFDLDKSHKIFKEQGVEAYAKHQQENEDVVLKPGVGFTLVRKLLNLNSKKTPIDVVLLSRNSADTGLRIFNSIEHYDLNIAKAAFTRGESTHTYLDEFDAFSRLLKRHPVLFLGIFFQLHQKTTQHHHQRQYAAAYHVHF